MSDDRGDRTSASDDVESSTFSLGELDGVGGGSRDDAPESPKGGEATEERDEPADESYFSDLLSEVTGGRGGSTWDVDDTGFDWSEGGLLSDSKSRALIELLRGAKNVLLLGPLLCPADYEVGTTLIGGDDPEPFNLLLVTFSQSPDERFRVCRSYLETPPVETQIIGVGGVTRSASSGPTRAPDGSVGVDVVSNPGDLKRIGIKINQTLNRWDEADRRTVLCFHSLSALLQYVDDDRRLFRFLSILRGRVQKSDGHAHYHMDRDAHGGEIVETIRPLFDAVITYDEDGTVSIRS